MWFPVGEAPESSAGRAVNAKWTLLPALQSLARFPPGPHPAPRLLIEGWQRHVGSGACGHKVAPLSCPSDVVPFPGFSFSSFCPLSGDDMLI